MQQPILTKDEYIVAEMADLANNTTKREKED